MTTQKTSITSKLTENRILLPPEEFAAQAHISKLSQYKEMYEESIHRPESFWKKIALNLVWQKPFTQVVEWENQHAKWFSDGCFNASVNCLDRHLPEKKNDIALVFEGEKGEVEQITYQELYERVCRFSNLLKQEGVSKGDTVAISMPMTPDAVVAMLSCARIGATHSVIFGGFSAQALTERIVDAKCKAVITSDGGFRRGKIIPLKSIVDEAIENLDFVKKVFVFQRTKQDISMKSGRDLWVHDFLSDMAPVCEPEILPSEHPLFILYTSGSTGKPKGIVHSTAGYFIGAYLTTKTVFDLKDSDLYWCTADIGWITGHSYVVYGPLGNGAKVFLYEGSPDTPHQGRFWELIDKHQISILYTAPTAIRTFMKWGDSIPKKYSLESLRLLGTVGEPINPEAWMWYYEKIGRKNCPIVDTWWQTETGSIMLTTLPGVHPTKPGAAGFPMFGVSPAIVDAEGNEVGQNEGGYLILKKPWPSMLRTIHGDDERYLNTYFSTIPGNYFAGDGARVDPDGYHWVMGRIDDVVNISGHRLGTAEVESALVAHESVAEAAVVGTPDEVKGEAIVAFVILEKGFEGHSGLEEELKNQVSKEIGSFAKPSQVRFTDALPKTRSGKIMRRLLRQIASGQETTGDTSTLDDHSILEKLKME